MLTAEKEINHNNVAFDSLFILLIYLFAFLSSICAVFAMRANSSLLWLSIVRIARFNIIGLDFLLLFYYFLRKRLLQSFSLNMILYLIYIFCISSLFFFPPMSEFLANALPWPLTFAVFYLYSQKSDLTFIFKKCLVLTFFICLVALYGTLSAQNIVGTNTGAVNYAITYLPIVLMICNKREKVFLSFITGILILISLKRAALITFVLGLFGYFLCSLYQNNSKRKRMLYIIVVMLMIFLFSYFALSYYDSYIFDVIGRLERMDSDQGSGRLVIWNIIWSSFIKSPTVNQVFGHGYHAVPYLLSPLNSNILAHNSYLETLYDLGMVGLIWIVFMEIVLFYHLIRMIREKNEMAPSGVFAGFVILVLSFVSYFFDDSSTILMIAIFCGVMLGKYKRQCKIKNESYR